MASELANVYTGTSDDWHDDYERGRPGWPPEVFGVVDLPPELAVLELGAAPLRRPDRPPALDNRDARPTVGVRDSGGR